MKRLAGMESPRPEPAAADDVVPAQPALRVLQAERSRRGTWVLSSKASEGRLPCVGKQEN